jgi:N-acetylmuramoyl-L-alanine amidase
MFAILSLIVKMLPLKRAAIPALLVLLTIPVSAAAEPSHVLSYPKSVSLLEKLDKNSRSTRDEWSRVIQSFLSISKTEKNRVIADRSRFMAGKSALALYRRDGKPEDLDVALRCLGEFTKVNRKDHYFIEGLRALKEADTLRRKRARIVPERQGPAHVAHPFGKTSVVCKPLDYGQKSRPPDTTLTSLPRSEGNWDRPADRHTGNPFWTPRNRNRGHTADARDLSAVPLTETDIVPHRSATPAVAAGPPVIRNLDINPAATCNATALPSPPPLASVSAVGKASDKEPQTATVQAKLASVVPTAKPESEPEKKLECSAKGYVVVIDPGHGGRDPGAVSQDGTLKEKDVTLDVAKATKTLLEKNNPGIRVELTRSDDKFMTLEARTAFANALNADLFISIHCNSDTDSSSAGIETYYLSKASSEKAMKVAATENNLSLAKTSDLQATLLDLMVTSKNTESEELATAVNNSLEQVIPKGRHRGVKQAPFYVLLGAKMPAILVECAFISSTRESKKLHSSEFLNTIAQGLANGAHSYIQGLGPNEGKLLQSADRTAKISK